MIVRDSRNRPIPLSRRIGGGGEGDVYAVTGRAGLVAKIYTKPTRETGEKLACMIDHPPAGREGVGGHVNLAWPSGLLYGATDRLLPVGYLMPHVTGAVPLLEVFNPRLRARTLPDFDRRYLLRTARNLAAVLATLHQAGYVVGDVNESNILVGPSALVSFIDCDSFQVQAISSGRVVTYACPVGKLEYTAPELQGKVFSRQVRQPEADRFGLGVLIFQLLMEGRHPFAGTWTGSGEPPSVEEKIRRGCFPYADKPTCPIAPPPNARTLTALPPDVAALMRRCFTDGHRQPSRRPAPERWRDALTQAERSAGAIARSGRTVHPTTEPVVERPIAPTSAAERAPGKRVRTAVRRRRGSGANAVSPIPRGIITREVVATLVTVGAIACTIAVGAWWLLQQHVFPFAGPAATASIDGGASRLAATTPSPPGNADAAAAGACTPATEAAAARRAATAAPHTAYMPLTGSWVASAPDLRVRFFGMPWWDELPDPVGATRYSVGTVPNGTNDRLDLIRVPGGLPATAAVWQSEYDAFTHRTAGSSGLLNPATVTNAAVTGRPFPKKAAGYDGYLGQFHYTANGAERIDATLWVGQVGCDRVVMIFAGIPARDGQIDQAVAQVLGTIDFNAR